VLFSDKLFPALGFGAKLPPQGQVSQAQVSHEFFLVSQLFVWQLFLLKWFLAAIHLCCGEIILFANNC